VSEDETPRSTRRPVGPGDAGRSRDPERPWNDWLLPSWDEPPSSEPVTSGSAPPEPDWVPYGAPQRSSVPNVGPRIRSVGEVTREVRDRLRGSAALRDLWVEGEVGQVSFSAAGHCYFTLKDERAQLSCVIFRDERRQSPFEPATGLRIVAHGRVDVFEPQGHYQLYVDSLQPAGLGDLALRLEASKARLAAEGLFEPARKRPLPAWPQRVGVVTSAQGAVFHDIRRVLQRRWPLVQVVLAPCLVQGDGAPASILAALRRIARWRAEPEGTPATSPGRGVDLIILARGGGSLEDLWAFNDERVVRAVATFPVPVVVGVGHETDVTLVEFAADVRAATPSVAAELAVPSSAEQAAALRVLRGRLATATARGLRTASEALAGERRALDRLRPAAVLAAERERIGLLLDRATRAMTGAVARDRGTLARASARLPLLARARLAEASTDVGAARTGLLALSPFATLERGYALVRRADGTVAREAAAVAVGEALDVRLARGALDARVERVRDSGA